MKTKGMCAKALIPIILVLLVVPLKVYTSAESDEEPKPLYGGTIIEGISTDPTNYAPFIFGSKGSICSSTRHMYDTLVHNEMIVKPDGSLEITNRWLPNLAESWNVSIADDGSAEVTFYLVKNATWHDGVKFTSADVKFHFEEIAKPYVAILDWTKQLEEVETPDDYTAIFKFSEPAPTFFYEYLSSICSPCACIAPKHLFEGTDILNNPHITENPIGTGPWILEEHVMGSHITYVRNPNYWKKNTPYLEKYIFKILPTATTRAMAIETGEVDLLKYVSTTFTDALRIAVKIGTGELENLEIHFGGAEEKFFGFVFNLERSPFDNKNVRKAIFQAIDRNTMNDLIYLGSANVWDTWALKQGTGEWWYNPDAKIPAYDPEESEKLLDEAGLTRGTDGIRFKTTMILHTKESFADKVADLVKDDLAAVGIDCTLLVVEQATFNEKVMVAYDYDIALMPTGTSLGIVQTFYHSKYKGSHVPYQNFVGYNNSRVDYLLDQQAIYWEEEKRRPFLMEIQEILADELPIVQLISWPRVFIHSTEFIDASPDHTAFFDWRNDLHTPFAEVYWSKGAEAPPWSEPTSPEPTWLEQYGTYLAIAVVVVVIVAVTVYAYRRRKPK